MQHVKPLLASFELGYNVTIFAYGQTGRSSLNNVFVFMSRCWENVRDVGNGRYGNTFYRYTMLGENGDGIIPRVVRDVMQMKKKVTLAFSYLEVSG